MNEQTTLQQMRTNHLSAINILREKFRRESLQRLEIQIFLTIHDPLGKFIDEKYSTYMKSRGMTP